ncbi:MBL fold metallo-hydrolase [Mycobacterium florentinum]|uniref:MBL fold metallo-hydrolase n=1 Tax=Mycobacterium florentinum TaxID=292462 RepID=A0A1X1TYV5_MYCFL|nr:MBL fold metallo-hydrolase [Mycobacterium florentinum]MCV7409134.1 MBL fold metallo-hydrolase [Mycobacterium florentinum]ORV49771.1 MBL fold metallo-hydrolase [Mycobacterium florentinum]BBX78743.1 MBL fold metallo-hydrolase [Mycobacterium florentinum]
MSRAQLGRACVTRIVEFQFELGTTSFAQTPPSEWHHNADLLVPDFFDPDTEKWRIAVQSWVVEVDGLTVVVDTGVGNDRQRPHMPPLDQLNTAFLAGWESAGIDRSAVDVVINTHIHSDHVGWNTMLDDDTWVPTFPNARYLAPAADYRYFAPDGPVARRSPRTEQEATAQRGDQLVFADSVLPIDEAGQLVQWSDDYLISPSLRLRAAAGHTPGSSVLWLDAGVPAVFVGDITHSPLQVRRPADPCAFDVDAPAAAATRHRIFTEAAQTRATVIPAHYPGHGGASIRTVADQFEVDEWLDIEKL